MVTVSREKPPQWILDKCKELFGVEWESSVVFTYDKQIYTYAGLISDDLYVHESHHFKQQEKMGADKWWEKFFEDEEFRLTQELECYQKQYNWVKRNFKDREYVNELLRHYAKSLSSEMYGGIISFNEALKRIKQ